jgi:hypothetical protein
VIIGVGGDALDIPGYLNRAIRRREPGVALEYDAAAR